MNRKEIIEDLLEIFDKEYLADLSDEELEELFEARYLKEDQNEADVNYELYKNG